jgi:hypothetical protein
VRLPRGDAGGEGNSLAVNDQVEPRAPSASQAAQRVVFGLVFPLFFRGSRRRARRAHARAVDAPEVPVDPAPAVEAHAQCLHDPAEGAGAAPAVEGVVEALPRPEPLGRAAPWRACSEDPEHASERRAVVVPSAAARPARKQGADRGPLLVAEFVPSDPCVCSGRSAAREPASAGSGGLHSPRNEWGNGRLRIRQAEPRACYAIIAKYRSRRRHGRGTRRAVRVRPTWPEGRLGKMESSRASSARLRNILLASGFSRRGWKRGVWRTPWQLYGNHRRIQRRLDEPTSTAFTERWLPCANFHYGLTDGCDAVRAALQGQPMELR